MTRSWLIVSIGALSFGVAACGDYDEKNAAYDGNNAAYDETNGAYDAGGNGAYDGSGNAAYQAPDANGAYPAPDVNATTNIGAPPPADPVPPANSY